MLTAIKPMSALNFTMLISAGSPKNPNSSLPIWDLKSGPGEPAAALSLYFYFMTPPLGFLPPSDDELLLLFSYLDELTLFNELRFFYPGAAGACIFGALDGLTLGST